EQFWALREVTLEVAQGETVAIIGPNGSGKSTLLSIIGNILLPTRGRVEVNGRTATLLDIGAGFHEDLTGVENVYLYGSLLGIKRRDLSRRLDDIIELAGLRDSIDAPIRTYSSGMQMRLGFSVAINVDPAILLIDEVLAVGDAAFQEKCRQKVRALQEAGKTILFVSHDMEEVMEVASRAVWLLDGRVAADGDVAEVVSKHLQHGANAGSLAAAST
ncbi:MAG: ABC transporter ATP-binding protein, partial [Armatimonadota bacterium]